VVTAWYLLLTKDKTYNSRYSPLVTHEITSLPISSLSLRERTGSTFPWNLWSYVLILSLLVFMMNRSTSRETTETGGYVDLSLA